MEQETILFRNREELRAWLERNSEQKESIWVVYYKKATRKGTLTMSEITDAAVSYGWIDSQVRKVDDETSGIRMSPRNPKSNWSRVNKERVMRLIRTQQMTERGMAVVRDAKRSGTWDALNDVENLVLPQDMQGLLEREQLMPAWEILSRSVKRGFLEQLLNIKTQATRERKVQTLVMRLRLDYDRLCTHAIKKRRCKKKWIIREGVRQFCRTISIIPSTLSAFGVRVADKASDEYTAYASDVAIQ